MTAPTLPPAIEQAINEYTSAIHWRAIACTDETAHDAALEQEADAALTALVAAIAAALREGPPPDDCWPDENKHLPAPPSAGAERETA